MFDTPIHTPSIFEKTRTLSMTTHTQCSTTLSPTQFPARGGKQCQQTPGAQVLHRFQKIHCHLITKLTESYQYL